MISWSAFDWPTFGSLMQAVSGLVVGAAAVIGAVRVGNNQVDIISRQADISDRQTSLLEKQIALESQRVTHELYDRRYKVYDSAAAFLIEAATSTQAHPSADIDRDFLISIGESRFLFGEEMHTNLRSIYELVSNHYSLHRKMANDYNMNRRYAPDDPERELDILTRMRGKIETLHTLFPELILGSNAETN